MKLLHLKNPQAVFAAKIAGVLAVTAALYGVSLPVIRDGDAQIAAQSARVETACARAAAAAASGVPRDSLSPSKGACDGPDPTTVFFKVLVDLL